MTKVTCNKCGTDFHISPPVNTPVIYMCPHCNRHYSVTLVMFESQPVGVYRDPIWLEEQYLLEGKTMDEIAQECSVSPMTINNWLVKHNIPTRERGRRWTPRFRGRRQILGGRELPQRAVRSVSAATTKSEWKS